MKMSIASAWRISLPLSSSSICFRSRTRGRFFLRFDLIELNCGPDEILQSTSIDLIVLEKIDRSPLVASEARVEERVWIWKARSVGESKLHLILVGVRGYTSLFCGNGFFGEHFADALDLCAYVFQLLFDVLVAAVDVVDAVDDGLAVSD